MENYISDLVTQLITEAKALRSKPLDEFDKGVLYGYYLSIQRMLNLSEGFGYHELLPAELQRFNPEELLDGFNK